MVNLHLQSAILASITLLSLSVNATTVSFTGDLSFIDIDDGTAIYSGAAVGDSFSGAIDDVSGSGFISDSITTVVLSCCDLRTESVPYEIFNDELLTMEDANWFNTVIGAPVFNAGDVIDIVDLEGRASTSDGGILAAGLIYVFDSSTFIDNSPDNYPFTADPQHTLFFIWEQSDTSEMRFDVAGVVSAVPIPASLWLFGSGLIGLVGIARRRKA